MIEDEVNEIGLPVRNRKEKCSSNRLLALGCSYTYVYVQ